MQAADQVGDGEGFVLAHAGGGFIQQQQPRLQRQGGGDLRGALVAVGEFPDQPVRLAGQAGLRQRLIDAAIDLGLVAVTEPEALAKALGTFDRRCECFPAPSIPEKSR